VLRSVLVVVRRQCGQPCGGRLGVDGKIRDTGPDPKYLYVGFIGTAANDVQKIWTVRRYDLSQFEAFTQPMQ